MYLSPVKREDDRFKRILENTLEMIPDNFSPENMSLVELFVMGRASSFFFQGLLDGHPNIVTIPFLRYVTDEECKMNEEELSRSLYTRLNNIFDEPLKKIVSFAIFKKYFLEYIRAFGITKKSVFIGVHYAYARFMNINTKKITHIVFQGHMVPMASDALLDFPTQKIIFLARDPRASYASKKTANPYHNLNFFIHTVYFAYKYYSAIKRRKNVFVAKHEDVHLHNEQTMRKVLKYIGVPYNKRVESSSYYGMDYTGQTLAAASATGVFSSRPNPKYVHDKWKKTISLGQARMLKLFISDYVREFKYESWPKTYEGDGFFSLPGSTYVDNFLIPHSKKKFHLLFAKLVRIPVLGTLLFRMYVIMWVTSEFLISYARYLRIKLFLLPKLL